MSRKRPFFLLEIIIAIALITMFSGYFLRSSLIYLKKERTVLLDLEFERLRQLHRMHVIQTCWQTIETMKPGEKHPHNKQVELTVDKKTYQRSFTMTAHLSESKNKYYDLILDDGKDYHFFIEKSKSP